MLTLIVSMFSDPFSRGTVTNAVDAASYNKANTDMCQVCAAITRRHNFMTFILTSVCTEHLEHKADTRNIRNDPEYSQAKYFALCCKTIRPI